MDELKQVWKDFKKENNELTAYSTNEIILSISKKSNGTMQALRKKVLIKLILCLFFTVLLAVYIPFAYPLPSQLLLLLLLIAYLLGDILFYQEYKILGREIDMNKDLLLSMKTVRNRIKKANKYEELIDLILYPFSFTAGFITGLTFEDQNRAYMVDSKDWIALIIAIIIFTPLGHWLAKWMNKRSFGKYLNRLEENITQLEKIEG